MALTNDKKARLRFSEWAKYADEDEQIIRIALKENGPPNQICFHSQQMAEKYLKGFLVFFKKRFVDIYLLKPGGACKPSIISQSISDLVPCPGSDNEPHPFYYTLAMSIPSQGSFPAFSLNVSFINLII